MICDNKDNAPANSMSPWDLYNQHYERVLQKFGGNFTKYDIAILKGRANPQMAIYLLLFNYFRNKLDIYDIIDLINVLSYKFSHETHVV